MDQVSPRDRSEAAADTVAGPTPQSRVAAPTAAPPRARRSAGRILRLPLMLGGIVVVVVGAGYMWLSGGRYVSTDDAYVQAAELNVTTDVSGLVSQVLVREGQHVTAGQELFHLGAHHFEIMVDGARAKLAQTKLSLEAMKEDYQRMLKDVDTEQAQVDGDQADFNRYASLVHGGGVTRAEYDAAHYKLLADQSRLGSLKQQAVTQLARLGGDADTPVEQLPDYKSAQSDLDEAIRQLKHTTVLAPFNGIVTNVESLQRGQFLNASAAAFGLVSTDDVFVTAQPKETQLTHVVLGQPVSITVDAYPGQEWQGEVESISPASGSQFSMLPAENSSGNWVKVVQRIPIRIKITKSPDGLQLRAGMSVEVAIDTGHKRTVADLIP